MNKQVRHIDMKTAARLIGVRPHKLLSELEKHDIFMRGDDGRRTPRVQYIRDGFFNCVLSDFNRGTHRQFYNKVTATANGLQFLREFVEALENKDDLKIKKDSQCQN